MNILPISELRKTCQKGRFETCWYARLFARKVSIYITWLFLHLRVTANQVTILQILISWLGCLLLFFGGKFGIIWTIIFWQLGYILDCVDGEIARAKKTSSVFGVFLDSLAHVLIIPAIFWSMTFFAYFESQNKWLILVMAILSMFLISPVKHAFLRGLNFLLTKPDFPYYKFDIRDINRQIQTNNTNGKKRGVIGTFVKAITEYPYDMNIFSLVLILFFILKNPLFLEGVLCFYFVLIILKEIYFAYDTFVNRQIEKEYINIKSKTYLEQN